MHTSMHGMTLIEMMVVIALIGIGMSVATPSFNAMIARNQATTQINELITSISFARSEASKISGTISMVPTNDDGNATTGDFIGGWCVVAGSRAEGDCSAPVIRQFPAMKNVTSLQLQSAETVQFDAFGALNNATTNITLDFCAPVKSRKITISLVGRVSVTDMVCP